MKEDNNKLPLGILDYEIDLFKRELDSFIPDRIFDAHTHCYKKSHFSGKYSGILDNLIVDTMDISKYKEYMKEIIPKRQIDGLFLGWPKENEDMDVDEKKANEYISEQVSKNPNWRGSMIIRPDMNPEFIREEIKRLKLSGLKCYRGYSKKRPTFNADITDYLPEEQVKIAHEEELAITLHIVKARSLADKVNIEIIARYCKRYPSMRLILAHAARGFNPYHLLEGIKKLKDLNNIWFDTSFVQEPAAFEIIIRNFGHKKLLYGSDFPLILLRGKLTSVGNSFLLFDENIIKNQIEATPDAVLGLEEFKPVMVGIESLRAIKLASVNLGLKDNQIEDIFYNNAKDLFKLV